MLDVHGVTRLKAVLYLEPTRHAIHMGSVLTGLTAMLVGSVPTAANTKIVKVAWQM